MDLIWKPGFWIAMAFALVVKLSGSPNLTRWQAFTTTVAAVTGALVFTGPALSLLGLGPSMEAPIAALVGLTCEHLARIVMKMTPKELFDAWRGKL